MEAVSEWSIDTATANSTVHAFMEMSSTNANGAEILQVTKAAAQRWEDGDTLLWDKPGATRRARNSLSSTSVLRRWMSYAVRTECISACLSKASI